MEEETAFRFSKFDPPAKPRRAGILNSSIVSHVQEIKEKLNIVDVVGGYIRLQKMGGNFKALCPFHAEKTPSFFVSPERGTFYCFGCGEKGDIFSFVEKFENLDFSGALKMLAERAGVALSARDPGLKTREDRIRRVMEYATIWFQNNLFHKEHAPALEYLKKRGLETETIKEWRIGFAPEGWRNLSEFLIEKKFSIPELLEAGLVKEAEGSKGKKHYDRFRGRIMFPISDTGGRVIAFSGRILDETASEVKGEKPAKYLNSPETPLFSKSKVLYGLDKAKSSIREKKGSLLVEGQMDLVLSHQVGVKNAIALSGTALTGSHVALMKRFGEQVTLALDSDPAGRRAALKSAVEALRGGLSVFAVSLPEGKDPADMVLESPDAWKKAVDSATHIIDFMLNLVASGKSGPSVPGAIKETVFPLVFALESEMDKAVFLKKISKKVSLPEESVVKDYEKFERGLKSEPSSTATLKTEPRKEENTAQEARLEKMIYGFLLSRKGGEKLELQEKFASIIGNDRLEALKEAFKEEEEALMFEAERVLLSAGPPEIEELLSHLKKANVKERLREIKEKLEAAERKGDKKEIERLRKESGEISKKL